MKVLLACEKSGACRRAFRALGHEAFSCDLEPSDDGSAFHFRSDVRHVLCDDWDLVIAFPPCTYLSSSGLHWNNRRPERAAQTEEAARFFLMLTCLTCKWAIENPVGCMSTRYRKPDQIIQPHWFGDDASKATCLWLHGLPKLQATEYVPGRLVNGRQRWANQTDGGQNKLPPSDNRATVRGITYPGIAAAMASQWGAQP